MTENERAVLWYSACAEPNAGERVTPARFFGDFEKFSQSVLKQAQNGLYNNDRALHEREASDLISRLEAKNRFAVTLLSSDYPELLKQISEPPLVIYGEGNRALLGEEKICIVGSRLTPVWAEKTCKDFAEDLAQNFTIVTGLAEGGDSAAIAGALPSGKLISVLPCGLDDCYPASHIALKEKVKRQGLLLSEFPFYASVHHGSFYLRNRILAGLSKGVLVVSAGRKSGALITANFALDYDRDVFVFPHNIGVKQGEGCNELLKHGAIPVTESEDVFFAYGSELKKKELPALLGNEARVMEALAESGELHAATVAEKTGLKIFEVAATLSALEMKGFVVKSGGNKYSALRS